MGSDLYLEHARMEPAFKTVEVKWAKDFDPVNGFGEGTK